MYKQLLTNIGKRYSQLMVVFVFNVPLILTILLWHTLQHDFEIISGIYIVATILGYYCLSIFIVLSAVFLLFSPFRRISQIVIGLFLTIIIYYLLIDSYAFGITRMHIDLFWIEWIFSDFDAFGLSTSTIGTAFTAMLILAATETGIILFSKRIIFRKYMKVIFWVILVLSFIISQVIHAVAYEKNDIGITGLTPYLPFYYGITSHKNSSRFGGLLPIGMEEDNAAKADQPVFFKYPLKNITTNISPDKKPPNIVMIFFESWRYDMMSKEVTPNVFALSQKSLVCNKHFSSGNSTIAGVIGFFYGIYPTYWTAIRANNSNIHNPALIDVLEDNGYDFGIFAKSNFKRHKVKDAVFRDIDVQETFAGKTAVENDADMTQQLINFLRGHQDGKNPFFTFLFYKSNHAPYQYPVSDTIFRPAHDENLMLANKNTDPTFYLNDYRNATYYVDKLIGQILKEIDSLGMMSNTIIIITTDHGEQFNDDQSNFWGHASNFTKFQTWVPMIIYAPDKEAMQIESATNHVDIVPTLFEEYFGCTNDVRDYSNGVNLYSDFEPSRPFVAGGYVNHAFIIKDNVYEIFPFYTRKYKLDNIKETADPPPPNMLIKLVDEISRFYEDTDPDDHEN